MESECIFLTLIILLCSLYISERLSSFTEMEISNVCWYEPAESGSLFLYSIGFSNFRNPEMYFINDFISTVTITNEGHRKCWDIIVFQSFIRHLMWTFRFSHDNSKTSFSILLFKLRPWLFNKNIKLFNLLQSIMFSIIQNIILIQFTLY